MAATVKICELRKSSFPTCKISSIDYQRIGLCDLSNMLYQAFETYFYVFSGSCLVNM